MSLFHQELRKFIEGTYPSTGKHPMEEEFFLPRKMFNKTLGITEVKRAFQDVKTLKKMAIDSEILRCYQISPVSPRVVLLTYVYWDGWGDFYAQQRIAKALSWVSDLKVVTFLKEGTSPPPLMKNQEVIFFTPSKKISLSPDLLGALKRAHLVLQCPTFYPFTKELKEEVGEGPEWEALGESGFLDTPDFSPGSGQRCLGLHPLEKGLLLPEALETRPPLIERPFYFAYTRTEKGLFEYLQALLLWKNEDLRVCTFKIGQVINLLKNRAFPGVKTARIWVDGTVTEHRLNSEGTELEIHVLGEVTQETFLSYLSHSERFVACTGDCSFAEGLVLDKWIYYDCPEHKKGFVEDLKRIAPADALPFFKDPQAIASPIVRKGLLSMNQTLREKWSANHLLSHLVFRSVVHSTSPSVKILERDLLEEYAVGNECSEKTLSTLKEKL